MISEVEGQKSPGADQGDALQAGLLQSLARMPECFGIFSSIRDESGAIVDFRISYLNDTALRGRGTSSESPSPVGARLSERLPDGQRNPVIEQLREIVETGRTVSDAAMPVFDISSGPGGGVERTFAVMGWRVGDGVAATWREASSRLRIEQQLARNEEAFRRLAQLPFEDENLGAAGILASITDALITFDSEWRVTFLNPRAEELVRPAVGLSADQLLGRVLWDAFPGTRDSIYEENYRRAVRDQVVVTFEAYWPPVDKWFDIRAFPIEGGGLSVQFLDVTARRLAQDLAAARNQELAQTHKILQSTFDSITDGLLILDREWRCVALSQQAASIAEKSREEIVGRWFWEVFPWSRESQFHLAAERAFVTGEPQKFEEVLDAPGPRLQWFECHCYPGDEGLTIYFHDITDRREARLALQESEERFRQMAESLPVIVWVYDAHGRQEYVNCAFRDFFGEQICRSGKSWIAFVHPDDHGTFLERYESAVAAGERYNGTVRVRNVHGNWRWLETFTQPRVEAENIRFGMVGVAIDVTDRVETAAAEAESRRRLQLAQEAARVGTFEWDTVQNINRWSPELEALYGLAPGSFAGTYEAWASCLHPEDITTATQLVQDALKTGSLEGEWRAVWPDGTVRWLAARAMVNFDEGGNPVQMMGVNIDITEQRELVRALRESDEQLRLATHAGLVGLWDWTASTNVMAWSDTMWSIYGREPRRDVDPEVIFQECLHPDDRDRVNAAAQAILRDGNDAEFREEFRIIRPDGSQRWIESIGRLIRHPRTGHITGMAGVNIDVTDRKTLTEQLQEADRRKDEFLATLAHELRNPLAAVNGAVHLLSFHGDEESIRRHAVEVLDRQVKHQTRLIDDLMDVSRLSRGKLILRMSPVELQTVIHQAVEVVQPLIEAKSQQLDLQLHESPLTINGDPARLVQLIGNLLSNAAKFSPEGSKIDLRLGPVGDNAAIVVMDRGIGIPPDKLDAIFELFGQLDTSPSRQNGGLGIGLSLVRQLVDHHGGTIHASSRGKGQGSTFEVTLPLIDAVTRNLPPPPPRLPSEPNHVPPRRILVVDDNMDSVNSTLTLLKAMGHDVRAANDGPTAVELALVFQPHLVLLDIGLPGFDGHEVARRIRTGSASWSHYPLVVALTGWGLDSDRQKSAAAGCDRHLVKPVDFPTLSNLVAESARLSSKDTSSP